MIMKYPERQMLSAVRGGHASVDLLNGQICQASEPFG